MLRNFSFAALLVGLMSWSAAASFGQDRTDSQRHLGGRQQVARPSGLLITQVQPRSTAQRQGIDVGDIIVNVNGQAVRTMSGLNYWLGNSSRVAIVDVFDARSGSIRNVHLDPLNGDIGVVGQALWLTNDVRPAAPTFTPPDNEIQPVAPIYPAWNPWIQPIYPIYPRWDHRIRPLPLPLPVYPGNPAVRPDSIAALRRVASAASLRAYSEAGLSRRPAHFLRPFDGKSSKLARKRGVSRRGNYLKHGGLTPRRSPLPLLLRSAIK